MDVSSHHQSHTQMTRIYFSLLLILITGLGGTMAQKKEFTPFSEFGVKAGYYTYPTYLVNSIESTPFTANMIGLRYLHVEDRNLGVLVELNYNKLSYNKNQANYNYDFIHLPFLANFNFRIGKSLLGVNLGSYAAYIMTKDTGVYLDNDIQFGMATGLNYSFPLNKIVLTAEGRYHYGFTTNNEDDETMRNSWLEFSLAISLRHYRAEKK
jgi:hypothetical protein